MRALAFDISRARASKLFSLCKFEAFGCSSLVADGIDDEDDTVGHTITIHGLIRMTADGPARAKKVVNSIIPFRARARMFKAM